MQYGDGQETLCDLDTIKLHIKVHNSFTLWMSSLVKKQSSWQLYITFPEPPILHLHYGRFGAVNTMNFVLSQDCY